MLFCSVECDGYAPSSSDQIESIQYYIHIFVQNCFSRSNEIRYFCYCLCLITFYVVHPTRFWIVVVLVGWLFGAFVVAVNNFGAPCFDCHLFLLYECTL